MNASPHSNSLPGPDELVLVGYTMKPFGLLGELKIKPESFNPDRHGEFHQVFFRKNLKSEILSLEVRSSRYDNGNWYIKFKNMPDPETVAHLSGGMLFVHERERLPLPENMVYFSDMIGLKVFDLDEKALGEVKEIQETGTTELLVVKTGAKDFLIPWTDHYVKEISIPLKRLIVDITPLKEIFGI